MPASAGWHCGQRPSPTHGVEWVAARHRRATTYLVQDISRAPHRADHRLATAGRPGHVCSFPCNAGSPTWGLAQTLVLPQTRRPSIKLSKLPCSGCVYLSSLLQSRRSPSLPPSSLPLIPATANPTAHHAWRSGHHRHGRHRPH